jgi:hypothetical protein
MVSLIKILNLTLVASVVRFPTRAREFYFFQSIQIGSGFTQPPIQWVQGTVSLGVKQPGYEADHLSPSVAEVKHDWSYTWCNPKVPEI